MAARKSLADALNRARVRGWTIWLEGYGDGSIRHWQVEAIRPSGDGSDNPRGELKSMEALISWLNALPKGDANATE